MYRWRFQAALKTPDHTREEVVITEEERQVKRVTNRKGIKDFWGKFKDGIIDLFKEEEDHAL